MPLRLTGTAEVQRALFNLSPLTLLEVWRKFYFDTVEPTGNAANNADPDGDSVANLMEYVTGQNPIAAPPDLRDWVPDDDLVHFVIATVAALSLKGIQVNHRGAGDAQYPPAMMLSLLIYCYATGLFSSRRIERATRQTVSVRFLCANTHLDHDTLCTFRRQNGPLLAKCFLKTLAHASQHAAHSYQKAGELITTLET